MRLQNKVAIITGSARGLGKAFALRFAREGAKLTICDIHDCTPVTKEIEAMGGEVLALKTDVSSEKDTQELAKKTAERFGVIDILVNNAGIVGNIDNRDFMKPIERLTADDWEQIMAVNIKGVFLCCKAVIPYMKKQNKGKIINISSTTAFTGLPVFLHYSTTKGGIITMTRGLARALGEFNINVNAIAPGMVMTEAMQATFSADDEKIIMGTQLIKKSIKPEDIAAAVLFLASDEADVITGQAIGVNGGEYLH